MANAASAPSAAATTTHCTARDASPATNSPGRCVVSYLPVRTVPLSLNSQPSRIEQIRALILPGREEQRAPRSSGSPWCEHDPAAGCRRHPFQAGDALLAHGDADCGRAVRGSSASISEAPSVHSTRSRLQAVSSSATADAAVAAAVDRQRLIAQLPSVAVRTMEHAATVQLAEAGNRRAGCRRRRWRGAACASATSSPDASVTQKPSVWHCSGRRPRPIAAPRCRTAPAPRAPAQELGRRRAVARQEAVQRVRRGVAGPAVVDDQHRAPAAAEHQRGAQPGGAGADDDDVDAAVGSCHVRRMSPRARSPRSADRCAAYPDRDRGARVRRSAPAARAATRSSESKARSASPRERMHAGDVVAGERIVGALRRPGCRTSCARDRSDAPLRSSRPSR